MLNSVKGSLPVLALVATLGLGACTSTTTVTSGGLWAGISGDRLTSKNSNGFSVSIPAIISQKLLASDSIHKLSYRDYVVIGDGSSEKCTSSTVQSGLWANPVSSNNKISFLMYNGLAQNAIDSKGGDALINATYSTKITTKDTYFYVFGSLDMNSCNTVKGTVIKFK